jgi:hypothetical protein
MEIPIHFPQKGRPMRQNKKKRDGLNARLRVLAWIMTLILALWGWGLGGRMGFALEATAALVFAVGTVWPHTFEGLYRLLGSPRKPRMAGKSS